MDNLIIEATAVTPHIVFKKDGYLLLEGKALPEDPAKFFEPAFIWLKDFHTSNTIFDVKLEYVNTSSSKQVFELLKILNRTHNKNEIIVHWYYEEGDYDILESGKYYASMISIPFEYIEYAETD